MKKTIVMLAVTVLSLFMLAACGCEHQWKEATCHSPKTCQVCGLTEGESLKHQWQAATCVSPKACSVCGEAEGEALGHAAGEWKTSKPATCTETGIENTTCTLCGEALEKETEKSAHTEGEWVVLQDATITTNGKRVKKCTVCDTQMTEEEFELSEEAREKAYKEACKTYKYEDIARAPADYKGELAKFSGEVIQVQQSSILGFTVYVLRVNVTKTGRYSTYYTDTMYVTYTASADAPRILEDDIITMYGELQGEKTYETILGSSVTIPLFEAEYIEIS